MVYGAATAIAQVGTRHSTGMNDCSLLIGISIPARTMSPGPSSLSFFRGFVDLALACSFARSLLVVCLVRCSYRCIW